MKRHLVIKILCIMLGVLMCIGCAKQSSSTPASNDIVAVSDSQIAESSDETNISSSVDVSVIQSNDTDAVVNREYPDVTEAVLESYSLSMSNEPSFKIYEISYRELTDIYMYGVPAVVFIGIPGDSSSQAIASMLFAAANNTKTDIYYVDNSKYHRTNYRLDESSTPTKVIYDCDEDYEYCLEMFDGIHFFGKLSSIRDSKGNDIELNIAHVAIPSVLKLNMGEETKSMYTGYGISLIDEKDTYTNDELKQGVEDIRTFILD